MEKNKKQALILSIVAVVTLITLVVGATFAYFKAQGGASSSTEVKVTTYTTDMLTFTTGSAISLYADQSSFGQEKGSLSGETFAKATLVANNKTNEATDNYYVYFNIENNTFKYTLGEDKPELILTVTGPDGNEVTEISGLTHKVVQDRENKSISGFDVTTTNGLITIANKKTITATTDAKEEQYTLKLTFVNYEGDQTANASSGLSAKVMIQKEKINLLTDYVKSLYTGTQGENGIYHHNGTIKSASEFKFEFFNQETHEHEIKTYPVGTVLDAEDNSYRFAGASDQVNNYVCFGSNATPCPADNLYRIIGVFGGKVKLIKSDYATSALLGTDGDYGDKYTTVTSDPSYDWDNTNYKGNNLANIAAYNWNKSGQNIWSLSNLNKTNLNTNFITKIGDDWAAKIAETTWKVGGVNLEYLAGGIAKNAYQNEVVKPESGEYSSETEYSAKIGLMYVSDYMYATPQDKWTLESYNDDASKDYRAATSVNWMYMGLVEWTITRNADWDDHGNFVNYTGNITDNDCYVDSDTYAVRPVFNLLPSVTYVEGDGTQNSPIRIN